MAPFPRNQSQIKNNTLAFDLSHQLGVVLLQIRFLRPVVTGVGAQVFHGASLALHGLYKTCLNWYSHSNFWVDPARFRRHHSWIQNACFPDVGRILHHAVALWSRKTLQIRLQKLLNGHGWLNICILLSYQGIIHKSDRHYSVCVKQVWGHFLKLKVSLKQHAAAYVGLGDCCLEWIENSLGIKNVAYLGEGGCFMLASMFHDLTIIAWLINFTRVYKRHFR